MEAFWVTPELWRQEPVPPEGADGCLLIFGQDRRAGLLRARLEILDRPAFASPRHRFRGLDETVYHGLSTTVSRTFEEIRVICFTTGKRIDTPSGQVAVEALHAGNLVATRRGVRPLCMSAVHRPAVAASA